MRTIYSLLTFLSVLALGNTATAQNLLQIDSSAFGLHFTQAFRNAMEGNDSFYAAEPETENEDGEERESQEAKNRLEIMDWRKTLYPGGRFSDVVASEQSWATYFNNSSKSTAGDNCANSSWSLVGPIGAPNTPNFGHNGRLDCIAFKPGDANTMYIGSGQGGGLWKLNGTTGVSVSMNTEKITLHNGVGAVDAIPGRVIMSTGNSYIQLYYTNWPYSCKGVY